MQVPVDKSRKLLRGQEYYWRVICKLADRPEGFTVGDVAGQTNGRDRDVREYMLRLVRGGYLQRTGEKRGQAILYKRIRNSHAAPRVRKDGSEVIQGRSQDHMWRSMKMLSSFSFHDLAIAASTEDVPISEEHARNYITHLLRAGYLTVLKPGGPNKAAIYRLKPSKNTGPQAPLVQRVKHVFDPNLNKVVWRSHEHD